jgi:hypothetical protein
MGYNSLRNKRLLDGFMNQATRKKLDPRARFRLPHAELKGLVEVLIRTVTPLDSHQRAEFARAGGTIRTTIGTTTSATVDANSLETLARLPFVRKIELSRTMFNE